MWEAHGAIMAQTRAAQRRGEKARLEAPVGGYKRLYTGGSGGGGTQAEAEEAPARVEEGATPAAVLAYLKHI